MVNRERDIRGHVSHITLYNASNGPIKRPIKRGKPIGPSREDQVLLFAVALRYLVKRAEIGKKYKEALEQRNRNPDQWYAKDVAILPIEACYAKYDKGNCWIIVCAWAYIEDGKENSLNQIKIWIFDETTLDVISFKSCC